MGRISVRADCAIMVMDAFTQQPVDNKNLVIVSGGGVSVCKGKGLFVYMGLAREGSFHIEKPGYYSKVVDYKLRNDALNYIYVWLTPRICDDAATMRITAMLKKSSGYIVFVKSNWNTLWLEDDIVKNSSEMKLRKNRDDIVEGRYVLLCNHKTKLKEFNRIENIHDRNEECYFLEKPVCHEFYSGSSNILKGFEIDTDEKGCVDITVPACSDGYCSGDCEILFYDYSGKEMKAENIEIVRN